MPNNKILFIVEGENDEVSFIRKMLSICRPSVDYEFYSYKCNIHVLAQVLYNEYPDFDSDEIDIQLVLKSKEDNKGKKDLLSQRFRDIFLVFDFDPQHDHTHFDTILRMLQYFDDSSDHGKLFINYPMMQSYKHFSVLPDDSFETRSVSIADCLRYKQLVGEVSLFTDINAYTYKTFISLLVHHIRKANFILTGQYCLPNYEEYLTWNSAGIYEIQYKSLLEKEIVYVLNTSIFIFADFQPEAFFRTVGRHAVDYDI